MSVLVVGVSHHTAPVPVLERLALDPDGVAKLVAELSGSPYVAEAAVISTCNRVEVYTEVDRFHGSIDDISAMLATRAGECREDVIPHLYVHYEEGAVAHLFAVAAGLDSMVVGESQILGQVREALRRGQDLGSVGSSLNPLFQQALRVGKRAHAETDIDRAGPSLVDLAFGRVRPDLAGRRVVVVGAGSLAALTVAKLARLGADDVVLANRTLPRARRLAGTAGGRAVPLARLPEEIAAADLLVSCTGAVGAVVTPADLAGRDPSRPLQVLDLAMPRDVDPAVGEIPGISVVDLADIARELESSETAVDVDAVRRIVAEEVAAFESARQSAQVTPTVVALRSMATGVVDAELERLAGRLPELDAAVRDEVARTVRRVADKLLHSPTVRVKELSRRQSGVSYAEVLGELFALDQDAVEAVTRPEVEPTRPDPASRPPRPPGEAP